MVDKNLHTIIDFGNSTIRAGSFNKETKKVENHLEIKIKNVQLNNLYVEEKLIEDLIFNLEKKNAEYLDEISLMVDNSNILLISLSIFKRSDEKILDDNFLKYIIDDAKFEIKKKLSEL